MDERTLNRRHIIGGAAALTGVAAFGAVVRAQDATPIPIEPATPEASTPQASPVAQEPIVFAEWPLYGNTIDGVKFTTNSGIDSTNVQLLEVAWQGTVGGPISSTPVIGQGLVVVGAYDGILRAYDAASGAVVWTFDTGAGSVMEPNLGIPIGVPGSAAIDNGFVFTGDATGTLHAINAGTGEVIWSTEPDQQPAASIWSSPVVANGVVYVGIASVAKEDGFRGVVVAVDAASGSTLWEYYVTPEGTDGGGVFAVPAIDLERGLLYVGTQNGYSADVTNPGNLMSVIALNLSDGSLVWSFSGLPDDGVTTVADDIAFSASPNLFTVEIDGVSRDLLGNGQKSGVFWALDRDTGEPVWSTEISSAGPLGGMEGTSAVGNGVIVVPATEWAAFDSPTASGVVRGLNASNGEILWTANQDAPNPAPVAIANDVVFQAGFDGVLRAYALYDGTLLWSYDLGASVSGGIAVAGDLVVLGAATPTFAPFIKGGDQVFAFRLPSVPVTPATPAPATPAPSTPVPETPTAEPTIEPTVEPTTEPTEEPATPDASPTA
jgi:polyvinyl alcohol dehydrogenase (cytochrome)